MSDLIERGTDVVRRLRDAGFEAWFAGGGVRDALLGRAPKDVDIATSAHPDQVQSLFRRTIAVGKQFGVIVVLSGSRSYDVATFRSDGAYTDGRHPDTIEYGSAAEDVERRDFTINGLLMDPETGEVQDLVGGRADLQARVIRTIGDAHSRLTEDRLRLLRAVKFAARLGFTIEPTTAAAVRALADQANAPSAERVKGELESMLTEGAPERALDLLVEFGLLPHVLPEVAAKSAVELPARLGGGTALERCRRLLAGAPREAAPDVMWPLLLGDLNEGSPGARGRAAEEVIKRLKGAKALAVTTRDLVLLRDRLLFATRVSTARESIVAAGGERSARLAAYGAIEGAIGDGVVGRTWPASRELPPPLLPGNEVARLSGARGRAIGRLVRTLRFLQLDGRIESPEAAAAYLRERAG